MGQPFSVGSEEKEHSSHAARFAHARNLVDTDSAHTQIHTVNVLVGSRERDWTFGDFVVVVVVSDKQVRMLTLRKVDAGHAGVPGDCFDLRQQSTLGVRQPLPPYLGGLRCALGPDTGGLPSERVSECRDGVAPAG